MDTFEKIEELNLKDEYPIHDFMAKRNHLYVASNNFNEGDKNKSIVKVFKIENKKLSRVVKRSFKNVQELTMTPSPDGSQFMVLAHQF